MNILDYAIMVITVLSVLVGLWRGFVREAISLGVWVAAFWLAYALAGSVEVYLIGWISDEALRLGAAFVIIFLAVHMLGFVVSFVALKLVKSVGLGSVDRAAGGGFGVLRAVVVISVAVLLAGFTPLKEEPFWTQSYFVDIFQELLVWVEQRYPMVWDQATTRVTR